MQPLQVIISLVPQPDGTTQVQVGSNRPLDVLVVARILSESLRSTIHAVPLPNQPPQNVIEVATPNRVAGILNGRG